MILWRAPQSKMIRAIINSCYDRQSLREDADMRIEDIRTLNGANIHHHSSVLVMTLNQEELAGKETHEVTGFMDQLLTLLPGIIQHHCASGHADGAVEPMPPTTGFDHIAA